MSLEVPRKSLFERLRDFLAEPRMAGVNIDGDARIAVHRRILGEKKMIRQVFEEVYRLCVDLDRRFFSAAGVRVELGAGASLMKAFVPGLIVTDVKPARHLDLALDAFHMPFRDASVGAFYGIDCFHHLPRPDDFFSELRRSLAPGGGCVLIEPYYGPVARRLYKNLFASEDFDPEQKEWNARARALGPMRGANQALSYVVFARDRKIFERRYPDLEIVAERPLDSYLRYLASGGLNFRPLAPAAAAPLLKLCERALKPLNHIFALHHVIALRKELTPARD
jgi:SAM-dependent methyltransferase